MRGKKARQLRQVVKHHRPGGTPWTLYTAPEYRNGGHVLWLDCRCGRALYKSLKKDTSGAGQRQVIRVAVSQGANLH